MHPFPSAMMQGAARIPQRLFLWGWNSNGQLGVNDTTNRSSPVQVGSLFWLDVACGKQHTIAIREDGTLWAFGRNHQGQLGLNNTSDRYSPVQVGSLNTWDSVFCHAYSSFAVRRDGTLWAWGYNGQGTLGNGGGPSVSSPIQVGALTNWGLGLGRGSTANVGQVVFRKPDGTLWSWGRSPLEPTGVTPVSSPVQLGAGTDWLGVSANIQSIFDVWALATKTNGELWAWGNQSVGKLGNGVDNSYNLSSPVQIGAANSWRHVACGQMHALAIKSTGELWSWGNGASGALGSGATTSRSSPVQVGAATNWSTADPGKLSAGGQCSAVIRGDGALFAWGLNNTGQLGQSDTTNRSSPVQVGSGTGWTKVSFGLYHIAGLTQ